MDILFLSSTCALSGLVARLRQSGVSVTVADTPEMVLSATRRHIPDAVVVELLDADSPGARVLEDLAKLYPRISRVGLALREELSAIWVSGTAAQRILDWRGGVRDVITAVDDMRRSRMRLIDPNGRALAGRVTLLPVSSWAMGELRALNSSVSSQELVKLLRHDPVLACQVLRWGFNVDTDLASSFRPLDSAVEMLGASTVREGLLALPWPMPVDPDFDLEAHCLTAVQVAGLSVALEVHAPSEQAFVVGLLHSIGRAALALEINAKSIGRAEDVEQTSFQRRTLGYDVAQLGAAILDLWGFPSAWASALESAAEPSRVTPEDVGLSASTHLASSLLLGRDLDLPWLKAQGVPLAVERWEVLRTKSAARVAGLRPARAQASASAPTESNDQDFIPSGDAKHTPASMALIVGLAKTLVGSDAQRFSATSDQLELIPILTPELQRDQDVFVVSAVLMALLQDLDVRPADQRALY